jgi:hypothetical protein
MPTPKADPGVSEWKRSCAARPKSASDKERQKPPNVDVAICRANLNQRPLAPINVSALSEARFPESVKLGEVLFARSIEPFEGGRWRLRWTRANGYGNSIFPPICKLLVLQYLENERVREPQFDALRWGLTCGTRDTLLGSRSE